MYTSRKGDRIERKIEVVLRAIIENGVDVKVKLKQRKPIKVFHSMYCCFFFVMLRFRVQDFPLSFIIIFPSGAAYQV
jgi:hypothetical protein